MVKRRIGKVFVYKYERLARSGSVGKLMAPDPFPFAFATGASTGSACSPSTFFSGGLRRSADSTQKMCLCSGGAPDAQPIRSPVQKQAFKKQIHTFLFSKTHTFLVTPDLGVIKKYIYFLKNNVFGVIS